MAAAPLTLPFLATSVQRSCTPTSVTSACTSGARCKAAACSTKNGYGTNARAASGLASFSSPPASVASYAAVRLPAGHCAAAATAVAKASRKGCASPLAPGYPGAQKTSVTTAPAKSVLILLGYHSTARCARALDGA